MIDVVFVSRQLLASFDFPDSFLSLTNEDNQRRALIGPELTRLDRILMISAQRLEKTQTSIVLIWTYSFNDLHYII